LLAHYFTISVPLWTAYVQDHYNKTVLSAECSNGNTRINIDIDIAGRTQYMPEFNTKQQENKAVVKI